MIYPETIRIDESMSNHRLAENPGEINLVLQRVRLYARRRILWLHHLWELGTNQGEHTPITQIAVDACLANQDNPINENKFYQEKPEACAITEDIRETEHAISTINPGRFRQIQTMFRFTDFEHDLIQACFAATTDDQFSRIFAYLNDNAGQPFIIRSTVQKLFGYSTADAAKLHSTAFDCDIIRLIKTQPGEPTIYELDENIIAWLSGSDQIPPAINKYVLTVKSRLPLESWPVKAGVRFLKKLDMENGGRIMVVGKAGSGKKTFLKHLLEKAGLAPLFINASLISNPVEGEILLIHRTAQLSGKIVVWCHPAKAILGELNARAQRDFEVILTNENNRYFIADDYPVRILHLPSLTSHERIDLWKKILPETQTWPKKDFETLYTQHRTTISEMKSVAESGASGIEEILELLSQRNHRYLGGLAERLTGEFQSDDLVLPELTQQMLDDLYFEARERIAFWENRERRRLFPQGRGMLTLFTGQPGTGKTMAAQVLSNRLGLDLYRVDLSTVVSKYVGETTKNLEQVIRQAENLDVVLFFDEADALFGRRTEIHDAHDRFANTDTGFLLQAIEGYDGVAILASNKRGNIDSAFIRRLRYVIEFEKPEPDLRAMIWTKLGETLLSEENYQQLSPTISALSQYIELTGAQIKYALLTGLFLARQSGNGVEAEHLLTGIERELMKEHQGLTDKQKEMILNYEHSH